MARRRTALWAVAFVAAASLACNAAAFNPPTPTPPPPTDTPAPTAERGWREVAPGLERRTLRITQTSSGATLPLTVLRIDPARYAMQVLYSPDRPQTVAEWQAASGASLVVNGGFFDESGHATALVVADGSVYGVSYAGRGGMVSESGGDITVRSLTNHPYQPGEALDQAVQGWPLLLYEGGLPSSFESSESPSRRTAVAADGAGRLLIVVSDLPLSLAELQAWMAGTPELDVDVAVNLDGGSSTGLVLAEGGQSIAIDSWVPVPAVLAFSPRTPQ